MVDGTTVSLADTEDNRAHYPQHGNQAEGVGFPLARLVGVISLASGALLGAALGPYQGKGTGEHGLFRELHEVFVAGDLMLADSYYCTYFLIAMMQNRGGGCGVRTARRPEDGLSAGPVHRDTGSLKGAVGLFSGV